MRPDLLEPTSGGGTQPDNGSLDAMVGFLQRLRHHIGEEGRKLARFLRGVGDELVKEWLGMCREVAAGQSVAVHDRRESLLRRLRSRLEVLKHVDELARVDGQRLETEEDLTAEIAQLDRLHARLQGRWRDVESLPYLAAEALMPSAEKLKALASKTGFPQAWYDQDDDPFQE